MQRSLWGGNQHDSEKDKGKGIFGCLHFYTIFVIFGVLGHGEAAYPFYPLAVIIMPYCSRWAKFCWKIYLSFIESAFLLIMIAHTTGLGPF